MANLAESQLKMRISELEDENEDLKQQVKDLEDTIYEYGEQEE